MENHTGSGEPGRPAARRTALFITPVAGKRGRPLATARRHTIWRTWLFLARFQAGLYSLGILGVLREGGLLTPFSSDAFFGITIIFLADHVV